ncbi:hypothetical protein CDAR_253111 [Caerostris darwini]|uniref:Uncharacterized protein n=1 Tax=Caerostris darwini TaxID=1538125 RepID=A0AAV4R850_9ARAC|nr:hypothetical protein CDAR_253111 [Caerostris darwini]
MCSLLTHNVRYHLINGRLNHRCPTRKGLSTIPFGYNRTTTGLVAHDSTINDLKTTVWLVRSCFYNLEITKWQTPKKRVTSVIDCSASIRPIIRHRSESSIRFLEAVETHLP